MRLFAHVAVLCRVIESGTQDNLPAVLSRCSNYYYRISNYNFRGREITWKDVLINENTGKIGTTPNRIRDQINFKRNTLCYIYFSTLQQAYSHFKLSSDD